MNPMTTLEILKEILDEQITIFRELIEPDLEMNVV